MIETDYCEKWVIPEGLSINGFDMAGPVDNRNRPLPSWPYSIITVPVAAADGSGLKTTYGNVEPGGNPNYYIIYNYAVDYTAIATGPLYQSWYDGPGGNGYTNPAIGYCGTARICFIWKPKLSGWYLPNLRRIQENASDGYLTKPNNFKLMEIPEPQDAYNNLNYK